MHFQDLARLQLELQAWERIRDSHLDHRAQQNSLAVRIRERAMNCGLQASAFEVSENGLHSLPDAPAKFNAQMEALLVLKENLKRREFSGMGLEQF